MQSKFNIRPITIYVSFWPGTIVQEGDKALIDVVDLVDSEDKSEIKEVHSLQKHMKMEDKGHQLEEVPQVILHKKRKWLISNTKLIWSRYYCGKP